MLENAQTIFEGLCPRVGVLSDLKIFGVIWQRQLTQVLRLLWLVDLEKLGGRTKTNSAEVASTISSFVTNASSWGIIALDVRYCAAKILQPGRWQEGVCCCKQRTVRFPVLQKTAPPNLWSRRRQPLHLSSAWSAITEHRSCNAEDCTDGHQRSIRSQWTLLYALMKILFLVI